MHRGVEVLGTNVQSDLQRLRGQRHADEGGERIHQFEAQSHPVYALRGEQVVGDDVLIWTPSAAKMMAQMNPVRSFPAWQ